MPKRYGNILRKDSSDTQQGLPMLWTSCAILGSHLFKTNSYLIAPPVAVTKLTASELYLAGAGDAFFKHTLHCSNYKIIVNSPVFPYRKASELTCTVLDKNKQKHEVAPHAVLCVNASWCFSGPFMRRELEQILKDMPDILTYKTNCYADPRFSSVCGTPYIQISILATPQSYK